VRFDVPVPAKSDRHATSVRFSLSDGAQLDIDDLLLYEPGQRTR
jgi:hypothetical protein